MKRVGRAVGPLGGHLTLVSTAAGAALLGVLGLVLWWTGAADWLWQVFSDREEARRTVEAAGFLAPVAYVLLLILQAVALPLPAPPVAVVGGYVFGTVIGFVLTWIGVLLGGMASFGLARLLGRGFVLRSDRLTGLDHQIKEHGAALIVVLRLIPLVSFDAVSYVAGLSGISFRKFVAATALGMTPGTFVFVYLGGSPPDRSSKPP